MNRLTDNEDFCEDCGRRGACVFAPGLCRSAQRYNKLREYELTGLEPEEVKDAKAIAERIATADYPHNFQRERSDIAAYMWWITDVMRGAKAWWNSKILTREEAEAARKEGTA